MSDAISAIRVRLQRFQGRYPQIAERFDFSYSTLSKFANGERGKRPSFKFIAEIGAALDQLEREADINTDAVVEGDVDA